MSREQVIAIVSSVSMELWAEGSRIFPSVRIAQAILETGGNIPSWNNLFGIKAGSGAPTPYWDGRVVETTTREVINGRKVPNVAAKWRAYATPQDSIYDHELFLQQPRYAAVRAASTPHAQCDALYAAGYATDAPTSVDGDPSYAEKLWSIIQSEELTKYDEQAEQLKDGLARLESAAAVLEGKTSVLEANKRLTEVPAWAGEAVQAAASGGVVNTPEGGSYDFYRILTVLQRKGLL